MTEQEQIKQMARITCQMYCRQYEKRCAGVGECDYKCLHYQRCEVLYAAGYHKQPEWISVEDRLPEEKGEYLVVYHPCWWDDVKYDENCVGMDSFRGKTSWAKKKFQRVTHWMPLPTPPTEKEN